MVFSLLGRTGRHLVTSAALAAGSGGEGDHGTEAAGAVAAEAGEDGDAVEDASEHGGQGAVQRLAFGVPPGLDCGGGARRRHRFRDWQT